MGDFIGIAVFLLIFFGIWIGVGHGMWVVLRLLLRATFGHQCDRCGRSYLGSHCDHCLELRNRPALTPPTAADDSATPERHSLANDLQAADRLLQYAEYNHWLSSEQQQSARSLIDSLNERVQHQPEPTQPEFSESLWSEAAEAVEPSAEPPASEELIQAELAPTQAADRQSAAASLATSHAEPLHPLDQPIAPDKPSRTAGQVKREVTATLVQSFLERANIRWVELISGLLIVTCSIGLVISLWSTLSQTSRFFPSLVFLLATVAVHAAGQYTLRQWKLRSTSRGVLHIGLMLIPLSVLVGILLSRRNDSVPQFDLATASVIAVGGLVYGGLILSATRTLFGRRFWPAAMSTILASSVLLPIHYHAVHNSLQSPALMVWLMPLLIAAMWTVERTTHSLQRPGGPARTVRLLGIVGHSLFASLIAIGFWFLQLRSGGHGLPQQWWLVTGALGIVWASWGWSFTRGLLDSRTSTLAAGPSSQSDGRLPWPAILTIALGCGVSLYGLLSLAQVYADYRPLTGLLVVLSAWWIWLGGRCQLPGLIRIGALAGCLAISASIECWLVDRYSIPNVMWIHWARVASLSGIGLFAATLGWGWSRRSRAAGRTSDEAQAVTATWLEYLPGAFLGAGCCLLGLAIALSSIAVVLPYGPTPYGGNWAPSLLIVISGIITAIALGRARAGRSTQAEAWGVPLVQLGLLAGTISLCQTSPILADLLEELRPDRAWSVGLAMLAVAWSLLAVLVPGHGRSTNAATESLSGIQSNLGRWRDLFGIAAVAAIVPSLVAAATASDHFRLMAMIAWTLPVATILLARAWQQPAWTDLTLIGLALWSNSVLWSLGVQWSWWNDLGGAASGGCLALLTLLVAMLWIPTTRWRNALGIPREGGWASLLILVGMWLVTAGLLLPLGIRHLVQSIAGSRLATEATFMTTPVNIAGISILGLAVVAVVAFTDWLARQREVFPDVAEGDWHRLLGATPLLLTLFGAAVIPAPDTVSVTMWIVAGWLIASEAIAWMGRSGKAVSIQAWELLLDHRQDFQAWSWLAISRFVACGLLILGAVALAGLYPTGRLTDAWGEQTGSWLANLQHVLVGLAPVWLFSLMRWSCSLANAESPRMTTSAAVMSSLSLAVCVTLALPNSGLPMTDATVGGLLFGGVAMAAIASILAASPLLTLGVRNYVALRSVLSEPTTRLQLWRSATRGGRWRRLEESSWAVSVVAACLTMAIAAYAACSVTLFPAARLPGLSALSAPYAVCALLLTWSVTGWLAVRRGSSPLHVLMLFLGLLAPCVAALYANQFPAGVDPRNLPDRGFEPFRLLVFLWMVPLGIDLCLSVVANIRKRTTAAGSSVTWLILSGLIIGLSLISCTQDPDPNWPLAQLSGLAMLLALSGICNQVAWRGQLAAVIAAVGLWVGLDSIAASTPPLHAWLVLWGPLWVALVSVTIRLLAQRWFDPNDGDSATRGSIILGTVDKTVSLHVPVFTALFSFVWIAASDWIRRPIDGAVAAALALSWTAVALAVLRLMDRRPGWRGLSVYVNLVSTALVTSAICVVWGELPAAESWLLWLAAGLIAMAITAGGLRELERMATRSEPIPALSWLQTYAAEWQRSADWMRIVHATTACVVAIPCVLLVLSLEGRGLRLAATALPFIAALGILPLAVPTGRSVQPVAVGYRFLGLGMLALTGVLFGWADLASPWSDAGESQVWHFVQRAFVACIALGIVYPLVARRVRKRDLWEPPLVDLGWWLLLLGGCIGGIALIGQAAGVWWTMGLDASLATKLITLLAWLAAFARLLQFAVQPLGREQLFSLPWRKTAVYVAEVVLVAFVATVGLFFPELFSGVIIQWWPIIMFAIAVVSAALGEWLRKWDPEVLADPVRQSSLLLPVLPLAGAWWIGPQGVEQLWADWRAYSLLLLIAAGLYGYHSHVRGSTTLRGLSLGLGLLSLWSVLYSNPETRFFEHPQFWLLPPALATLIFVERQRDRLSAAAVTSSRYASILVAYMSSTAEVMLSALGTQLWQPIILLTLALLGIAAGIVLRVRAFLFCGLIFSVVALLAMVWHAQQAIGQVWPWWVFGIGVGTLLIVMLGYFEKNRESINAYTERLKQWDH